MLVTIAGMVTAVKAAPQKAVPLMAVRLEGKLFVVVSPLVALVLGLEK